MIPVIILIGPINENKQISFSISNAPNCSSEGVIRIVVDGAWDKDTLQDIAWVALDANNRKIAEGAKCSSSCLATITEVKASRRLLDDASKLRARWCILTDSLSLGHYLSGVSLPDNWLEFELLDIKQACSSLNYVSAVKVDSRWM